MLWNNMAHSQNYSKVKCRRAFRADHITENSRAFSREARRDSTRPCVSGRGMRHKAQRASLTRRGAGIEFLN
jgi:hypothetical protein